MSNINDFKRLAGMSPSRPSMTESKDTPPLDEVPEDIIGSGARAVEMAMLGELKLGITSTTRRDPQPPQASLGISKPDDKKGLSPGMLSLLRKKKPAMEAQGDEDLKAKAAKSAYYIASGKAHTDSHLAHALSGQVHGKESAGHQLALDAHKAACFSHDVAKEMLPATGLEAGEDMHDQKIADHEKAMLYHGKKLGM